MLENDVSCNAHANFFFLIRLNMENQNIMSTINLFALSTLKVKFLVIYLTSDSKWGDASHTA